ncbi:MAG: hypothetical protein AAF403_02455, partial [Pseudomonadota bacterium]
MTAIASDSDITTGASPLLTSNFVHSVYRVPQAPVFQGPSPSPGQPARFFHGVGKTRTNWSLNEFIFNGQFETGDLSGWILSRGIFDASRQIVSLPGGGNGLMLSNIGGINDNLRVVPDAATLGTSETWVLSFSLSRSSLANGNDRVYLLNRNTNALILDIPESSLPPQGQSQTFTYTFTSNFGQAQGGSHPVTNFQFVGSGPGGGIQDSIGPILSDVSARPRTVRGYTKPQGAYGPAETALLYITGLPAGYRLSTGTVIANRWTVRAEALADLSFTPPSSTARADFDMDITSVGVDTVTGRVRIGGVTYYSIGFQGSLENLVVDYDEVSSRDDEFTLALNHHDVDEDAIIFYRVSNVDQGTG